MTSVLEPKSLIIEAKSDVINGWNNVYVTCFLRARETL